MSKMPKVLLIIIIFFIFFQAGLFSSYTIITSEPPDVQGLIDLQIRTLTEFFSQENINHVLIKDPEQLNISNKAKVADAMAKAAKVDGVDIRTINVTTQNSTRDGPFEVEISALAFSSPNSTKGSLILSGIPDYSVTVSSTAYRTSEGSIEVNTTNIKVVSILKLVNTDESSINFQNSSKNNRSKNRGIDISFG